MKKPSPMQIRKSAPAGGKRMQAYANKRNSALNKKAGTVVSAQVPLASQMGRDNYDAQYDLDTLTRAAAIKADKKRHGAALGEAKKRHAHLQDVMRKV